MRWPERSMQAFGHQEADDAGPGEACLAEPPFGADRAALPFPATYTLEGVPVVNLRFSPAAGFRRHDLELHLRLAALDELLGGGFLQELYHAAVAVQHERLLERVAFAGDSLVTGAADDDAGVGDAAALAHLLVRRLGELEAVLACLDGTALPAGAQADACRWTAAQLSIALARRADHDLAGLAAWPSPPILDSVVGRAAQAIGNAALVPAGEASALLAEALLLLGGAVDAAPGDAHARVLLGWLQEHYVRDDAAAAGQYAAVAAGPDAVLALLAGRAHAELLLRAGATREALAAAQAAARQRTAPQLLVEQADFLVARIESLLGNGTAAASHLAPLLEAARDVWHLAILAEPDFNACLPVQALLEPPPELTPEVTPEVTPELTPEAAAAPAAEAATRPDARPDVAQDFSAADVETVDYSLAGRRAAAQAAGQVDAPARVAEATAAPPDDVAIAAAWFAALVEPRLARLAVACCGASMLVVTLRVALATPRWDAFAFAGWAVCAGMGFMAWTVLRKAHSRLVVATRTWAQQSLAEQARERFSAAIVRRQAKVQHAMPDEHAVAPDEEVITKSRHWFASLGAGAVGAGVVMLAGPGISGEAWTSWPWWGVALPLVLLGARLWGERWTH